jgi:hypothetical protein
MNPYRRRWLLRLAAVLVLGLMGLLWFLREQTRELVVENHSGETITDLNVTLADQTMSFQDVPQKGKVTSPCQAKDGDHFAIDGQLADKTRIRMSGVLRDSVHFLVLPNGEIQFRPKGKDMR